MPSCKFRRSQSRGRQTHDAQAAASPHCRLSVQAMIILFALTLRLQGLFGFSVGQQPLREVREGAGLNLPVETIHPRDKRPSQESIRLLDEIVGALDKGDWQHIKKLFTKYRGGDLPIFNAVMHAACM